MSHNKLLKGGDNNCGINTIDNVSRGNKFIKLLAIKWQDVYNKSVAWATGQMGYFFMTTLDYNSSLEGKKDKSCTDFNNHIHIYKCDIESFDDRKSVYLITLYISLKYNNYHINPFTHEVFDIRSHSRNQNFILKKKYTLKLYDKLNFNIAVDEIFHDLIAIYNIAIQDYEAYMLDIDLAKLHIDKKESVKGISRGTSRGKGK